MRQQINTSVKMLPTLYARVQSLAETRQRSVHALMLQAIESYVTREEQRESLRLEALAAHDAYMKTGLHITGEEMDTWLAELELGHEVESPKCHA